MESDAFPTGMELFPAADDDAWTLIKRVIDESDYYLLIIGGMYGSQDDDGVSFTEKEFDYAILQGKPVMAFVHGSPGKLKADRTEPSDVGKRKLAEFRKKVKQSKHVKLWTSPEQLQGQVALTFNKFARLYPATGWIRADRISARDTLEALEAARKRIAELEKNLEATRSSPPAGAEGLADGSDLFELPINVKPRGDWVSRPGNVWVRMHLSWDELFGAVAPLLIDECEQELLRAGIESHLMLNHWSDIEARAKERLNKANPGRDHSSLKVVSVHIDNEDLGTIIVQFMALGLITKSQRRRSVSDTGTYWTLTPFGSTRTVQLRAIRRPS